MERKKTYKRTKENESTIIKGHTQVIQPLAPPKAINFKTRVTEKEMKKSLYHFFIMSTKIKMHLYN